MKEELKTAFENINNALLTLDKPSTYFKEHIDDHIFNEYPLNQIKKLKDIDQNPKYHKEGNVYNHTMLTIDVGAKKRNGIADKQAFMWGLLLHDIGKLTTTKVRKGKITSYNHDKEGEHMAIDFLEAFGFLDEKFVLDVSKIVRWHMEVLFVSKNINNLSQLSKLVKEVDIHLIAIVSYCDKMGRFGVNEEDVLKSIDKFLEKAEKYLI